jgi:DNA-binding winged helix-turn-helix (wHTH) protein
LPRYRFAEFTLSPRRRTLVRGNRELRLIPRYFDLLVFLVEHRHEAVHRRDIFERVWNDVVVSDSALSQAVRTLRRTLGDDSRDPLFIRTVSRHGYRFVCPDVIEQEDNDADCDRTALPVTMDEPLAIGNAFEPLLQRLTRRAQTQDDEEQQRDAAERLHALGTAEALAQLGTRPGHGHARALLRDVACVVPQAGAVPILGQPAVINTAASLIALRLRRLARVAGLRAIAASLGAGGAGALAGAAGGTLLAAAPTSSASADVVAVLAAIGGLAGGLAGAAVGAGISMAEAVARSRRVSAVAASAMAAGGIVGSAAQWLGRWSLSALVGVHVAISGSLEGLVLGAASGIGYAGATRGMTDGLAAPRGGRRLAVAGLTSLTCALGALILSLSGRPLVGGTIHVVAQASAGSEAQLTPIGRMIGDPDFGPLTRTVIGTGEGALFGLGLALGLTHRWRR